MEVNFRLYRRKKVYSKTLNLKEFPDLEPVVLKIDF